MKKRFVIVVDDCTPEEQDAVTTYLKGKGGFWHWFSDLWLFTTTDETMTGLSIRKHLREAAPGNSVIVLQVEVDTLEGKKWTAFAPEKAFGWLRRNWE